MNEKDSRDLRARTKSFALRIIRLYASLPKTTEAQVIGKQLLCSGTSVGARLPGAVAGLLPVLPRGVPPDAGALVPRRGLPARGVRALHGAVRGRARGRGRLPARAARDADGRARPGVARPGRRPDRGRLRARVLPRLGEHPLVPLLDGAAARRGVGLLRRPRPGRPVGDLFAAAVTPGAAP